MEVVDNTSKKSVLSLFVLFDFAEQLPGIATVSAIFKPVLQEDEKDILAMLQVWIDNGRNLVVRWPKETAIQHWNPTIYERGQPLVSDYRCGTAKLFSNDRDYLRTQRETLIKQKRSTVNRELFPTDAENRPVAKKSTAPRTIDTDSSTDVPAKIKKWDDLVKETEQLKDQCCILEDEVSNVSKDLAIKENEVMELRERVEELEKQLEKPDDLVLNLKENLTLLQTILNNQQLPRPESTTSNSPRENNDTRMVPLYGQLSITSGSMRKILIAGRTGKSDRDLNATVSALLDAFWKPEELAELCLSGKSCPSKPGSVAKKKIPEDILDAITQFLITRWSKWHPGTNLTTGDVKKSIGSRLLNCHTTILKKKKKANICDNELEDLNTSQDSQDDEF